jgi:hypothetical protein
LIPPQQELLSHWDHVNAVRERYEQIRTVLGLLPSLADPAVHPAIADIADNLRAVKATLDEV